MAGCEPAHFPVVLAAVQALLDPAFNLRGVQTTDENVAPLLVVNGPLAARLGINAGWGALGPGWPANAAIGRAAHFVMHNLGGGWPGAVSFAGLGQPGRYTLCLAERDDSPWPPLHVEQGYRADQSTVTLLRAETVINVTGGLDELASVMGSAASLFGILHGSKPTVIFSPFTARRLAALGWTREHVRRELFARGRLPADTWRRSWIHATVRASDWPDWAVAAAATRSPRWASPTTSRSWWPAPSSRFPSTPTARRGGIRRAGSRGRSCRGSALDAAPPVSQHGRARRSLP